MPMISKVDKVSAHILELPLGVGMIEISALGEVNTTGWTHPRLSPVFYDLQPKDGIWDFDFIADPPIGIVAPVIMPVGALYVGHAPAWCKGVRIHAVHNAVEAPVQRVAELAAPPVAQGAAIKRGHVIVHQNLASYDDSFQPTGTIHWKNDGPWGTPLPHPEWKKLHHDLVLTVEGPDEAKIRDCIQKAIAAGIIAAIVAAVTTGGGALGAALSAAIAALKTCLGDGFSVRIDDNSHWIYWDM
jgi:hypothetical protein